MTGKLIHSIRRGLLPFWRLREIVLLSRTKPTSLDQTLARTMGWLCRAQDVSGTGGVSEGYDLRTGWRPPFPETTGYIIPTFFDYAEATESDEYRHRAIHMLEWLLTVQTEEGSIPGVMEGAREPIVFDTGQVLFGFVRGYEETGEERFKNAAVKAGDWLVSIQDADGKWIKHTFLNRVHTYNTRTAWALLELHNIHPKPGFRHGAKHNIQWALKQQERNGWFEQNAFDEGQPVFTHTIAYAARGIWESGLLLKMDSALEAAKKTADVLIGLQNPDGSLHGSYNSSWQPTSQSTCLTGNAQVGILWLRIFEYTGESRFIIAARNMANFLLRVQEKSRMMPAIHGGIKGSIPLSGNYLPYVYPNWAAKFMVDFLLLLRKYQPLVEWSAHS